MSLRDIARTETERGRGGGCTLGEWTATLDDKERQEVIDVLLDIDIGNTALSRAIDKMYKVQFGRDTIANHRKRLMGLSGGCKCPTLPA